MDVEARRWWCALSPTHIPCIAEHIPPASARSLWLAFPRPIPHTPPLPPQAAPVPAPFVADAGILALYTLGPHAVPPAIETDASSRRWVAGTQPYAGAAATHVTDTHAGMRVEFVPAPDTVIPRTCCTALAGQSITELAADGSTHAA